MLTHGSAFSLSRIRVSAGAMEMEMAMTAAPLLPALARPRWCYYDVVGVATLLPFSGELFFSDLAARKWCGGSWWLELVVMETALLFVQVQMCVELLLRTELRWLS